MEAIHVAFKILNDDQQPPPCYQHMECHLMFHIKLDGFQQKAQLVMGGHMTETPAILTYASVVSHDPV